MPIFPITYLEKRAEKSCGRRCWIVFYRSNQAGGGQEYQQGEGSTGGTLSLHLNPRQQKHMRPGIAGIVGKQEDELSTVTEESSQAGASDMMMGRQDSLLSRNSRQSKPSAGAPSSRGDMLGGVAKTDSVITYDFLVIILNFIHIFHLHFGCCSFLGFF